MERSESENSRGLAVYKTRRKGLPAGDVNHGKDLSRKVDCLEGKPMESA